MGPCANRAAGAAATLEGAARQRAELGRELDALDEELSDTARRRDGAERALGDWRRRWAEALAPLGLPPEASAAVATAVLEAAGALARKQEEAAQLRGRIRIPSIATPASSTTWSACWSRRWPPSSWTAPLATPPLRCSPATATA